MPKCSYARDGIDCACNAGGSPGCNEAAAASARTSQRVPAPEQCWFGRQFQHGVSATTTARVDMRRALVGACAPSSADRGSLLAVGWELSSTASEKAKRVAGGLAAVLRESAAHVERLALFRCSSATV